jgi:hypothetical protein
MAGMPYLLLGGMGFWFYRSMKAAQQQPDGDDPPPSA